MTIRALLFLGGVVGGLSFPGASAGPLRIVTRSAMAGRDTGVTFEVANDANRARMVRFACVSVGDAPCPTIAPAALLVPAKSSGIARLVLDPTLGTRTPGVYVSYIVAVAGRDTARREVVFSVDRRSPLAFLGTAWTVRVVRGNPFRGAVRSDTTRLPLPADVDTAFLETRVNLAALAGPQGAVAYVRRAGPIAALNADMAGLPVIFTGLTTAGDYVGSLTLVPGAANGKVALTVRLTDWWLWPAVAILLGIVLAYLLQRYSTVERAYLSLKADVLRTASQWEDAQQRYAAALRPAADAATHVQYALGVDFLKQCTMLLADVDALGRPLNSPLDASNTAYTAAQQRLVQLQACLTSWPAFADEISALTAALDMAHAAVTALHTPPPSDAATVPSADPPAVLAAAARLQRGGPIGVATLAAARADVTGMTAFLGQWIMYARRVVADRARVAAVSGRVDAGHQGTFDTARGGIAQARDDLQWASAAADITVRGTDRTLAAAEGQLAQLEAVLPATTRAHGAAAQHSLWRHFADDAPFRVRREVETEAAPGVTADSILDRIRVYDVLFFLLTLLVAVATGFKSLYLGQNTFGTLSDYLTAVLWGFGTKYTLDTLSALIGRFFGPMPSAPRQP